MSKQCGLVNASGDAWASQAAEYAAMMLQGPMLPLIRHMYTQMQPLRSFSSATTILDVGSGPGSATYSLLNDYADEISPNAKLIATDFSAGMVEQVKQLRERRVDELQEGAQKRLWENVQAQVMDAQDLSALADDSVSHLTASLVLFMVPDSNKALSEIHRVLETGGVMSCSSWKYCTWMNLIFEAVDKGADAFKLPPLWANVEDVRKILEEAGFVDVKVEEVETCLKVEDPKRVAEWFLGSKSPALAGMLKEMSEEQKEKAKARLVELLEERKDEKMGGVKGTGIVASGMKK